MPLYVSFSGSRLRAVRHAAGVSRMQLAVACDVHYDTVRAWESGLHAPQLATLLQAANALSCEVEQLLLVCDENGPAAGPGRSCASGGTHHVAA